MTIQVTQTHIDAGRPGVSDACAIALAVAEALEHDFVLVHPDLCADVGEIRTSRISYVLPHEANEWAWRFDRDKSECAPFEFEFGELL